MGQFITPDNLPDDTFCRQILIPNDPKWIGAVSGALMILMYPSEWSQVEGISAEAAAERARQMLNEYWQSTCCGDDCMNCCEDRVILHRFDPETGRPQVSIDNGATWTTDPADPEHAIPLLPPLVTEGGSKTKCDAATNASEHVNELIAATSTNLETAGTVFELAVAVAEAALLLFIVVVTGGAASPLVIGVATSIWAAGAAAFELGKAAYDTYWTVDKQDAILCAIFCNIGDNGQFTDEQYAAFKAEVYDTLPASPALDIVMSSINAGGARGLSQMASYGAAALADCGDCDCDDVPNIYFQNDGGNLNTGGVEVIPDEDGIYTVTCDHFYVNGYYGMLKFALDPVSEGYMSCGNITILSLSGGGLGYKGDCGTGSNNALSTCWSFAQWYRNAPWTMTFTLTGTPC